MSGTTKDSTVASRQKVVASRSPGADRCLLAMARTPDLFRLIMVMKACDHPEHAGVWVALVVGIAYSNERSLTAGVEAIDLTDNGHTRPAFTGN